ncbi:hypothetical protein [Halobacteriovorax sp. DPLXC-1]|uniref:hypothetical protein n=1 Tax=Halobacteriovorax sp. DPLXC-1 TaxID=3110771 RepID=UPI002FF2E9FA
MLTLEEVMEPYSHIRLATKSDNDAILNFYKDIHMQTGTESLSFDRGENFFEFYERKGNHYWSFVFLNDDETICGVGTIIRQIRHVNGEFRPVAYFCDLRVSPVGGRRAKVQWRKLFKDIIEALPNLSEELRCEMSYTAILSDNERAIKSLTKNGRGFNYRHIDNYHVYSVVCPPVFNPARGRVQKIDFKKFNDFYRSENSNLELREQITDEKDNKYFGVFDGAKLSAVFMITDKSLGRRYKLYNMQAPKRLLTKLVQLMGRPGVSNGILQTLEVLYLSFEKSLSNEAKKEMIMSILKYFSLNKTMKDFHICNLYTGQEKFNFSYFIDGIIVESTGHMFEIHGDTTGPLWPVRKFRFEGSVL